MIVSSGNKTHLRLDIGAKARLNGDYVQFEYFAEGLKQVIAIPLDDLKTCVEKLNSRGNSMIVSINLDQVVNLETLIQEFIDRKKYLDDFFTIRDIRKTEEQDND